jgi:hypothetical protein
MGQGRKSLPLLSVLSGDFFIALFVLASLKEQLDSPLTPRSPTGMQQCKLPVCSLLPCLAKA